MKIYKILKQKNIFLNRKAEKKDIFLKHLVHDFAENLRLTDSEEAELLSGIYEREDSVSTGIGKGIAIPHCRKEILDNTEICCATIPDGMKFNSIDGKPVRLVFLTFSQTSNSQQYMQILAHLSRLLMSDDFKEKLLTATNSEEIINLFKTVEKDNISESNKKMNYLVGLILGDDEFEKDAINAFVESGIINAQIIESASIANKLQFSIPLFGSFGFGANKEDFTKLIFGFTDNSTAADSIYRILKDSDYDIEKPGAGTIFCVILDKIIGGVPDDIDI